MLCADYKSVYNPLDISNIESINILYDEKDNTATTLYIIASFSHLSAHHLLNTLLFPLVCSEEASRGAAELCE